MPPKLERCIRKVRAKSGSKVNPYAVCAASTGIKRKPGGGYTTGKRRHGKHNPSNKRHHAKG